MDCRKLLWSCLFAFNSFGIMAADSECSEGTVLFREDFGGNNASDPDLGPALPAGTISLQFSNHIWNNLKNGYDIRKEAIRRRDNAPRNHVYAGWYADFGDHTYEDDLTRGYFMIIDLDNKEATFYRKEVNNLCENTNLTFSFWGRSLNASSDAPVTITLEDKNGNTLAQQKFILSKNVYAWTRFELPFLVPEGETSIVYKVYSGAGGNGGDLALDDIEVRLCKDPVNVNRPDTLCVDSDYKLNATFDNSDNTYVEPLTYTWFKNDKKSYDEEGWTKVATGSSLDFPKLSAADEGFYKVFISSAGVEGSFDMCNSSSDIVEIRLKTCDCIPNDTLITETICKGEKYFFGGEWLTIDGVYEDKLTNVSGCDSLVTLKLTVVEQKETLLEKSICKGGSFDFGGKTLTEAGTYEDKLLTADGCDSIVTLKLTVVEQKETLLEESICKGGSFSFGGKTLTEAGTYEDKLLSADGCDSIVTLKLTVVEQKETLLEESICKGGSFDFGGKTLTEAGTYEDKLLSADGCDSIVTLKLTVVEQKETLLEESICKGGSFSFGGKTLTEDGTYEDKLLSADGCDSIVTLKLTVVEQKETLLEESICKGGSFSFGGKTLTEAGTYEDKLLSADGCDSIVTLKLTVVEQKETLLEESICKGGSFSFGGKTLTEAGTYEDKLLTADGCDSIVTLKLTVVEQKETLLKESICKGGSFSFGGKTLTEAGTYEDKLLTADGCDSIVTLKLTVVEQKETLLEESICKGGSFEFGGKTLTEAGTYEDKLLSADGCDSIVTLKLSVVDQKETLIEEAICQGESYSFGGQTLTETGTYEDKLLSTDGCDSLVTLKLTILEQKETTLEETITQGESFSFGGKTLTESGTYKDYQTTASGCDSLVILKLTVEEKQNKPDCLPINPAEYMSPNEDGIKDTWEIENLTCYSYYTVKIYDRYGKLLIEYVNEYPGWDGQYLNHPMPSTDYWYVISIEDIDKEYVGHFTIIR